MGYRAQGLGPEAQMAYYQYYRTCNTAKKEPTTVRTNTTKKNKGKMPPHARVLPPSSRLHTTRILPYNINSRGYYTWGFHDFARASRLHTRGWLRQLESSAVVACLRLHAERIYNRRVRPERAPDKIFSRATQLDFD